MEGFFFGAAVPRSLMFFVGVVANAICGGGSMSGCVKLWNLSYQARLASHAGFPGWLYVLMGVEQPHELMTVHLCIRAREKESCHISKDKKKVVLRRLSQSTTCMSEFP
ncbi:MAG: hypothetical protein CL912_28940 [Deltaproteobacteria bacterium]|nr:hypothetical protein [Deltaproteobacteria bacterium]|tara:strand:+ start:239 stop:565 length:327 start_codon:yes stop_codon:yes gene_type:complete